MTRIKICGITDEPALRAAADAGADAVGFVFHPKSRRFIESDEAFELSALLPPFIATVGLFVDCPVEKFTQIEESCPTTLSQLHGQEPDDLVRACGPGLIKAVRFDAATIERELKRWNAIEEVDAILIDGSAGGEGQSFDWSALAPGSPLRALITKPLILAGGLTPQNVAEAIRTARPFAVDVSSGVEFPHQPGKKDPALISAFCRAVRQADDLLEV